MTDSATTTNTLNLAKHFKWSGDPKYLTLKTGPRLLPKNFMFAYDIIENRFYIHIYSPKSDQTFKFTCISEKQSDFGNGKNYLFKCLDTDKTNSRNRVKIYINNGERYAKK